MLEGRRKMEDVISHRNRRLSSCICELELLQVLRSHRIVNHIVYHQGNRYDARGQASKAIHGLLSEL